MIRHLTSFLAAGLAVAAIAGVAHAQASPSAYTSATRYDKMGRVTGKISPNDTLVGYTKFIATRTTYDPAGRPTKVESGYLDNWQHQDIKPSDWAGFTVVRIVETTYNAQNAKLTERVKGWNGTAWETYALTQYSYDSSGRLECTAVRMNRANYGSLPPSACDQLLPMGSDGPDRITKNVYDEVGQLVQVREGVGASADALSIDGTSAGVAEVTYSYTPNGKIRYVIDAAGNRAEKQYDTYDRLRYWVFPSTCRPGDPCQPTPFDDTTQLSALATAGALNLSDLEAYTYDPNGNRKTLRTRHAESIAFEYDKLNRMTRKTVPPRAGLDNTHTRDVHYTYDPRGLMTSALFRAVGDASPSTEGLTFTYDGFGRKTSETLTMDGVSRTLGSEYDKNGNRLILTHPDDLAGAPRAFWYYYDDLDRPWSIYLNNSSPMILERFDAAGRQDRRYRREVSAATWYPVTGMSYEPSGRLSSYWSFPGTAIFNATVSFTYNPAGQIASRSHSNKEFAFGGYRTADTSYTANGLNQYTATGSESIGYDANGNLTSDGVHTYTYDVENRLVRRLASETSADLRYDPLGRLYEVLGDEHLEDPGPDTLVRFLHDGDALVAEYNASGALIRRYIHGTAAGDDPLVWFEGSGVSNAERRYLYTDERGSIVAVTDSAGGNVIVNTYDEYGRPNGEFDPISARGRFRYTGQAYLPELGMYYYKARIYSPTLGRFMQVDPIGYEDQFNLYAYVGNDPTNMVDPKGLYICDDGVNCDTIGKWRDKMIESRDTFDEETEEFKRINDAINNLGEMGEEGITIKDGGKSEKGDSASYSNGVVTIYSETISIQAHDMNGDEDEFGASVLGHEVDTGHMAAITTRDERMAAEVSGFTTEDAINRGLGNSFGPTYNTYGRDRETRIREAAEGSVDSACRNGGGAC